MNFRDLGNGGPSTLDSARSEASDLYVGKEIIDFSSGEKVLYEPWLNLPHRDELVEELSQGVAQTLEKYAKHAIALNAVRNNIYGLVRGAWQVLLAIDERSEVLDFGCGLGAISRSLARNAGKVTGVDACYERLLINQAVNRECGFDNIQLVCANHEIVEQLPDDSLDGIVLNGVLEWIPTHKSGNPRDVQVEFLRNCRRMLRSDGWIYIGIENRWGFKYFLGRPDDHTGLLFGSLLPRWLADVYSRAVKGHPYRTYTYGPNAITQILRDAGFESAEVYGVVADYRDFDRILPLGADPSLASCGRALGICKAWKRKLVESPAFFRRFVPSLGVVGHGHVRTPPQWLDDAPAAAQQVNHIYVKYDQAAIWHDGPLRPGYVREVCLSNEARAKLERITALSEQLAHSEDCPAALRACRLHKLERYSWIVRPVVTGAIMSELSDSIRQLYIQQVLCTVTATHSLEKHIEGNAWGISEAFNEIALNADRDISDALLARLRAFLATVESHYPKRRILMHGDCKPANVVVTQDRVELIDWEWAAVVDFPGYDILKFNWSDKENPQLARTLNDTNVLNEYIRDDRARKSCEAVHPGVEWLDCVVLYWCVRIARSISLFRHGGMPVHWEAQNVAAPLGVLERALARPPQT